MQSWVPWLLVLYLIVVTFHMVTMFWHLFLMRKHGLLSVLKAPPGYPTKNNFDNVRHGMGFICVTNLLGEQCKRVTPGPLGECGAGMSETYRWFDSGQGLIEVVFKDGRVVSKHHNNR